MALPQFNTSLKLAKALGLPDKTRSFVLRCAVNEATTVIVEYFPDIKPGELPTLKREQWTLNELPEQSDAE